MGEAAASAPSVNDGQWHQFVAISDAATGTYFWVDGTLYEVNTTPPVLDQSAFNLMIGENPGARNREFNGELDEFAIWNRVLTEDEIAGLWAGGAGSPLSIVLSEDADGDGLPNIYEINNGLDPNVSNIGLDTDGDGLLDTEEYAAGTHPNNADTDGDGYPDGAETGTGVWVSLTNTGTDPVRADTDGDGLLDGVETNTGVFVDANNTGTNPLARDTDGDYTPDGDEVTLGTDPTLASSAPVFGDGLIANWPFDGSLVDPVGGHDGIGYAGETLIDPLYEPAKFGQGALLTGPLGIGAQEYIEAGGPESDFDRGGGSVTISGWFRVGNFDTDWQALVAKGEGSNYRVARRGADNSIAYAGGSGEPAAAAPAVNDGEMHHFVAVSRANVQTELWIDGVRYEVGAAPTLSNNDQPLLIGANPDASPRRYWNGVVDDFAIWSRALTPAEILLIWNGGTGATIASLLEATPAAVTSIGLNFGADEPVLDPPQVPPAGSLTATDVAGAPGVAQANWNNLSTLSGSTNAIVANAGSSAQPILATVSWSSANTWASTGRSEENNGLTGADKALMTGYLDTGADTTSTVTISGIPGSLAENRYDVYVYCLGGVAGRGGSYQVVDPSNGAVLRGYIKSQSPALPTAHVEVPTTDPSAWGAGTYVVFKSLTATSIRVEATTVDPWGFGDPNRAPINAIQLVPSTEAPQARFTSIVKNQDGTITVTWEGEGVLEAAQSITGPWQEVDDAASPYTFEVEAQMLFGRIKTE